MEKFTEGPWKQPKETLDERSLFIGDKTGNFDIAVISFDHSPSIGEARANAALIAACPTMFRFIQELASDGNTEAQKIILGINA